MKALDYEGRRNVSGERVRQKRTERKITQAELAAQVQCEGVALEQDAISRIESGQRMVQDYELRALAEVLGASMDWLAGKEKKQCRRISCGILHIKFRLDILLFVL